MRNRSKRAPTRRRRVTSPCESAHAWTHSWQRVHRSRSMTSRLLPWYSPSRTNSPSGEDLPRDAREEGHVLLPLPKEVQAHRLAVAQDGEKLSPADGVRQRPLAVDPPQDAPGVLVPQEHVNHVPAHHPDGAAPRGPQRR